MHIPYPFVVYTGEAVDFKQAKTAFGVYEWTNKICCQLYNDVTYPSYIAFSDLPVVDSFYDAVAHGAKTLLLGYSPYNSELPERLLLSIKDAISAGLNVASGLHSKLNDNKELSLLAERKGVKLFDFRHRDMDFPKGNGLRRSGLRLLTVGTDCACGKKYTALSISNGLTNLGIPVTFRSTGQTGFLISGSGINNDTIKADFLSGAAEWLSPDNAKEHWDIIEGQGALSHPSFCAGSLSLLRGSQPDLLVMCHDPMRETQRGVSTSIPDIRSEIEANIYMARLANSSVRLGAVSLFGKSMFSNRELNNEISKYSDLGVPVFDPKHPNNHYYDFLDHLAYLSECAKNEKA